MDNFTFIVDDQTELDFYSSNNMDGVIHSLPEYKLTLMETAYLVGVNRIKLRSYSTVCEELVTEDLADLGQFVHSMKGIIG